MRVRPAFPNAVIRYPTDPTRRIPDEGADVPEDGLESLHWHRLLLSGDLVRVNAPPTGLEPTTPLTTR